MVNDNQFYIIDDNDQLYQDKEKKALLPDAEIIKNINDGTFPTQKGIDGAKILIKDNELFRIVKMLNPDNAKVSKRGFPVIKDVVELKVGNSAKRYEPLFDKVVDQGIIYLNGKRFKKIFCNSSQNRGKKALFITDNLYDKVMQIALCGIDPHDSAKKKPACKWNSYLGLLCTDSDPVTMPNIVVIHDRNNPITDNLDVIKGEIENDKYELLTDIKSGKTQIKINCFDGAGLVDISLAKTWAKELGLDYIPSSFQFRAIPGIKGNLYSFDILKFAETYNVRKIKDIRNKEWDLYDDKIDCIMTESQVKFADLYNSYQEWYKAFTSELYGYHRTFNICSVAIPYKATEKYKRCVPDHCMLSYQPLQTLQFSDEQIKSLCSHTITKVKKAHTDIDSFIAWRNIGEDNNDASGYTPAALRALPYRKDLAGDTYVKSLISTQLANYRRTNCIRVQVAGSYQTLIPDIFGLAQWAFGIKVTGLLNAKEVYNKYYIDRHIKQIDLIRFPHIACEHALADVVDESSQEWNEMQKWYKYQDTGYITSMYDTFALRLGTADFDGDEIYGISQKEILDAVQQQEANTIYFDPDSQAKGKIKNVTADDYTAMAQSDAVGFRNDIGTTVDNTSKLWSMIVPNNTLEQNNKIMDYIKIMSAIDSLIIDFVKSGIKADMPQDIKAQLKGYKNPWFFQFRTQKEYTQAQIALKNLEEAKRRKKDISNIKQLYHDSDSNMNRIAHYMFNNISQLTLSYDVPEFDWKTLLVGEHDNLNEKIYKSVDKELRALVTENHKLTRRENIDTVDSSTDINTDEEERSSSHNAHMRFFYSEARTRLLRIQPNEQRLVNDLLIAYYTDKAFANKKSKAIVWECFPEEMLDRCKNKKSKGKIYDINVIDKRYQKVVEAKKKREEYFVKNKSISFLDKIDSPIYITSGDRKYVDAMLKTQRSKKLYYALLYIWLKINVNSDEPQPIKIGYCKRKGEVSKNRLYKLAGIKTNQWEDAVESLLLDVHHLIDLDYNDPLITKVNIIYNPQNGAKIKLPDTCKLMRKWIGRNAPTKKNEKYECIQSKNKIPREQFKNNKPVIRLEDKKQFASASIAADYMGVNMWSIDSACLGKQGGKDGHMSCNYHWMFLSEYQK